MGGGSHSPLARFRFLLGIVAVLLVGAAAGAAGQTVVVAVDSSRSLTRRDMQTASATVREILGHLPPGTVFGLMAFDDAPRWIVEPPASAGRVVEEVAGIAPEGRFTLLNDALFTAARDLGDGGVIVLLTDGRDEGSATTVEDVAGICRQHHVRILPIGAGRHVARRALRRLAMLTNGEVLGHVGRVDAAEAADTILVALNGAVTEAEAARPKPTPAPAPPEPTAAAVPAAGSAPAETPRWLLPLLVLLVLGVLAVIVLLWRWRAAGRPGTASGADRDWKTDPAMMVGEGAGEPGREDVTLGPTPPMEEKANELLLDPSAFERLPFDGDLERTSVLDEQHILSLHEKGKKSRSFKLREDRAFAVGRAPGVNTLVLGSRALSAQHFKIVPHEGGFAIVDLDSTNGTLVNGRKIRAHHLKSGDMIQAGDLMFEYRVVLKPLG